MRPEKCATYAKFTKPNQIMKNCTHIQFVGYLSWDCCRMKTGSLRTRSLKRMIKCYKICYLQNNIFVVIGYMTSWNVLLYYGSVGCSILDIPNTVIKIFKRLIYSISLWPCVNMFCHLVVKFYLWSICSYTRYEHKLHFFVLFVVINEKVYISNYRFTFYN